SRTAVEAAALSALHCTGLRVPYWGFPLRPITMAARALCGSAKSSLELPMKLKLLSGLCALLLLIPTSSFAQISRLGDTFATSQGLARGSGVAYDTINDVYLVVGSHGVFQGRFVRGDGTLLGAQFPMPSAFAQFPNVAYSPDAGAFLVTWYDQGRAWAQLVSYPAGPVGGPVPISPGYIVYEVYGAPVTYGTTTGEFLSC